MGAKRTLTEEQLKEKSFLDQYKLFFSSLSARAMQYAYLNLEKHVIVLSNSSTTDNTHGDRLMDYSVGELGFHVVRPYNTEFLDELYQYLHLNETDVVCLKVNVLAALLNKIPRSESTVTWYGNYLVLTPKGVVWDHTDKRYLVGGIIQDFHILRQLRWWHASICNIGTDDHRREFPYIERPFPTDVQMVGRIYFLKIDTSLFTRHKKPIFDPAEGYQRYIDLLGIDGLTSVSLKELLKRYKKSTYQFNWYSWVMGKAIYSMATFENSEMSVRTIRPYTPVVPLQYQTVPSSTLLEHTSD